jgi:hypothetical protein
MYSIGELSRRTGVKVPTIRYYESIGLILERIATGCASDRAGGCNVLQALADHRHCAGPH